MQTDTQSPDNPQEQPRETPTPKSSSGFADKLRQDKRLFFGLVGGVVAILLALALVHTFTGQKPTTSGATNPAVGAIVLT